MLAIVYNLINYNNLSFNYSNRRLFCKFPKYKNIPDEPTYFVTFLKN